MILPIPRLDAFKVNFIFMLTNKWNSIEADIPESRKFRIFKEVMVAKLNNNYLLCSYSNSLFARSLFSTRAL